MVIEIDPGKNHQGRSQAFVKLTVIFIGTRVLVHEKIYSKWVNLHQLTVLIPRFEKNKINQGSATRWKISRG